MAKAPGPPQKPVKPILVIAGQTASGKSALAMRAARQFGGEIICADSRTIYAGMDIGTAKPSAQDRRAVPHHGLDLIEPNEYFSAAAFKDYASIKVSEIQGRGKLPIIVGGTGLYIDGFVYDFNFGGQADRGQRAELEAMSLLDLQARARAVGIEETQIDFKNHRHLSRAIERAGIPKFTHNKSPHVLNKGTVYPSNPEVKLRPDRKSKPGNILLLGINIEREQLIGRIKERVDTMFAAGFIEEVQNVINQYGSDATGLLTPGYKAARKHLAGEITLDEAKDLFIRSDKNLAKRQKTWFKRNQDIIWVQSEDEAMKYISTFTKGLIQ